MFGLASISSTGRALRLAGVAALAFVWANAPAGAEEMKVRLGYQYTLWGLPAVVAIETGLFEKHGLDIQARRFGAGKDARDALVAESIDIGTVGGTPFIVGAAVGQLIAIGTVAYTGKSGCIVATKSSGIRTIEDLKGKKIASRNGSTIDLILKSKILPAHKLDPKDVTIVNVDFPDQVAAIAGGSTDAFAGVEPSCVIAEANGIARYVDTYEKYDLLPNMIATTPQFVQKNPQAATAFMKAMLDASKMFKNEPKRVAEIIKKIYSKNYNMDEETVLKLVGTIDVTPDFVPNLPAYFEKQVDELVEHGRLRKTNVDWNKALDGRFLREAKAGK